MNNRLLADYQKLLSQSVSVKNDIGDEADQAGDERNREVSILLTGRIKASLMAIKEALKKIEEGTYGICEECGKKIEPGRVRVMPLTKLCLTCQSRVEVEMSLEKWAEEQLRYEQLATEPKKKETD
jgi:DnaK suppressor protein